MLKIAVPVSDCPLKLTLLLVTSPVKLKTVGLDNAAAVPFALPSNVPVNVPVKLPEKLVAYIFLKLLVLVPISYNGLLTSGIFKLAASTVFVE